MRCVALYNLKGGVGKTAAAVNLAYLAAAHGIRTLLWDLDPQGADYFRHQGFEPRKLRPFYSMADRRRSLHRELIEHPPALMARRYAAVIPYASSVERMGEHRAPLAAHVPAEDPALLAYAELWLELQRELRLATAA